SVFGVRFNAWIWLFSSQHNTIAFSGGARYNPMMSATLASSSGSVENLNVSAFHGFTPSRFQAAATVTWLVPKRSANSRDDQCVTPKLFGGGVSVSVTIRRGSTDRLPPERFSSASPAM